MVNQEQRSHKENKYINALKTDWSKFANIVFAPLPISILVISILLVILVKFIFIENNPFVIQILIPLAIGILSTVITKRWDNLMGKELVKEKGKSATRSLKLLFEELISLEYRCRIILNRYWSASENKQLNKEVIKVVFEELINKSLSLETQITNSIENWNDILLDEDTQNILDDVRRKKEELTHKLDEMNKIKAEPGEKDEQTLKNIKDLEANMSNLRKEINNLSINYGVPSLGSSLIVSSGSPSGNINRLHSPFTGQVGETFIPTSDTYPFLQGATGPVAWQNVPPSGVTVVDTNTNKAQQTTKGKRKK
jgi:hypothetical protein